MKRSLSLALEVLVKWGTCLAACVGCSSKAPPPAPAQPRQVHWKGQDSGYEDTTTVQRAGKANSAGHQ